MNKAMREFLDLSEAQMDADGRVLRNVTLITAGMSANRRLYSEAVLEKAAPLFEGVKAYDGHKRGPRSVGEITGWYTNVRYDGGKLRADRYFANTDAGRNVMAVAEDIVTGRAPASLAGLSINAVGTARSERRDGVDVTVVEAITGATSVDDVDVPAAGGTYLAASDDGDELTTMLLMSMTYDEWFNARADYRERALKEWKTARQDTAVTAAKAEADRLTAALQEAEGRIAALTVERDAARTEAFDARRELAVSEALSRVALPAAWKVDLRAQLLAVDEAEWPDIIGREQRKAQAAPRQSVVTGAGQQVQPAVGNAIRESVMPLPHEDAEAYARRMNRRT